MRIFASERSDEEKKEIYDKWKSLINMSKKELVEWGKDPDHLEASLNREEAKDNGKIQSGYDSFHRIKRRKDKPFEDWTAQDFDNASQENGFNGRMLGGKPGKPVGSTGMSKWEISLRNWGHDPSKPNSPSHSKWKSWKKQNEEEIKMSLAKKKKANLVLDLYRMSFKVKGGENLRKACLACLKTRTASSESNFKFDVLVAYLDSVKKEVSNQIGSTANIIKEYLEEKGIFNGKNILSMKLEKPVNYLEKAVANKLKSIKDPKSIFKFMGDLIEASTPEEISAIISVSLEEVKEGLSEKSILNKGINKIEGVLNYIHKMDTLKFYGVKLSFSMLKVVLLQVLLLDKTLVVAIHHMVPVLGVILILAILTNANTTANLLKKLAITAPVIPLILVKRIVEYTKEKYSSVKQVVEEYASLDSFLNFSTFGLLGNAKNLFGVKEEALKLASTNPQFNHILNQRLYGEFI